ncbi:hypothetical protein [Spirosoma rhododendri]|uniref:Uncharacterized protein n=1 Tax=Spirosoma rhododendri TaxID=2728024 RepID=A0A7L5DSV9_9BACT|nr:hypothetical protein [Spirosoma rhododendri]QJD80531.1 hypothetical protein HH216_20480 [Spirosoma rhododendri]
MNRRIRPSDLDQPPYHELTQLLANQWSQTTLPDPELTHQDYIRTINTLLLTTQNPERTADVTRAVLLQATTLHKSARWVEQELKFEGMIEGADRADFLLFDLYQSGQPDDAQLDLYNERMQRFVTHNS